LSRRAAQTLACIACGLTEPASSGAIVEPDLRSPVEDRWRAAYRTAGSGQLRALREADPELLGKDSGPLTAGLRRIRDRLPDAVVSPAVGHNPTNVAAVSRLTSELVAPNRKGAGVIVVDGRDHARVEPLP